MRHRDTATIPKYKGFYPDIQEMRTDETDRKNRISQNTSHHFSGPKQSHGEMALVNVLLSSSSTPRSFSPSTTQRPSEQAVVIAVNRPPPLRYYKPPLLSRIGCSMPTARCSSIFNIIFGISRSRAFSDTGKSHNIQVFTFVCGF